MIITIITMNSAQSTRPVLGKKYMWARRKTGNGNYYLHCDLTYEVTNIMLTFYGTDLGSKVTEGQRAQGVNELQIYRDWFRKEILTSDENGEPDSIIALPLGKPVPEYRDQVNKYFNTFIVLMLPRLMETILW